MVFKLLFLCPFITLTISISTARPLRLKSCRKFISQAFLSTTLSITLIHSPSICVSNAALISEPITNESKQLIPTTVSSDKPIPYYDFGKRLDRIEQTMYTKEDAKNAFAAFEKHIDEKMVAREKRQDEKLAAREKRQDEKLASMETRTDSKLSAFEKRTDSKMTAREQRGMVFTAALGGLSFLFTVYLTDMSYNKIKSEMEAAARKAVIKEEQRDKRYDRRMTINTIITLSTNVFILFISVMNPHSIVYDGICDLWKYIQTTLHIH